MLTLFACPKPFTMPHIRLIQRNAIGSWTQLKPRPEILLLGNEEGVAETAAEFRLRHIPELTTNEFGTPLLNSIFSHAESDATNPLLCYVNTDIILMSDFMAAAYKVACLTHPFLMVGQRWDMDISEALDYDSPQWQDDLRRSLAERGVLHWERGIDYFLFPRNFWGEIPPFALGRTAWDQWLLFRARQRGAALIDATEVATIVHQNHDYAHISGGKTAAWQGKEARRNNELAGICRFTLSDANRLLTSHSLIRARRPVHRLRARDSWPILHPAWAFPYRVFRKLDTLIKRALTFLITPFRRRVR